MLIETLLSQSPLKARMHGHDSLQDRPSIMPETRFPNGPDFGKDQPNGRSTA